MPTARRDKPDGTSVALLVVSAIVAGAIAAFGSTLLFSVFTEGEPADLALFFACLAAISGAFLGLCSCVYIVPLLWRTRMLRAAALVLGTSVPLAIAIGGLTHPGVGALMALVTQVATSTAAFFLLARPPRTVQCEQCGFDCTGIRSNTCPECGGPSPNLDLLTKGHCQACRVGKLNPNGICEACGTLDFNRPTQ
jgi:hypothetical protein